MAGHGVVDGTMTLGDFVAVNAFLIQLYMPLNMLGFAYREIRQRAGRTWRRCSACSTCRAEIADRPGAPALAVGGGEIVFDHVDFHYEKARPILHDVSFRVPAGNTVAIVGSSGAGKSTVSRILFRFYDVASRHACRSTARTSATCTQASLRAAIGVVPQDTVLFNDTIYYNIAYGRPERQPRGGRGGRPAGADPRFHRGAAAGLRRHGGRARPEALGRREAARGDRPHHPQEPAHPAVRRGDQRARHAHRAGDPALAGRGRAAAAPRW